jgi:hypothetical protein
VAPPPNRAPLIMAQRRPTSTVNNTVNARRRAIQGGPDTPVSGLSSVRGIDGQRAVLPAKVGRLDATGRRSRGSRRRQRR